MIPGATVPFGGKDYTLPTINLRISYMPDMDVLCKPDGEVPFGEYTRAAGNVLFALFQRNYPEMTRDEFDDLVELPMLKPVITGMMHISGYAARPLAVKAEAESPPVEPPSSDSSTAPPDGSPTTSSTD